MNSSQDYEKATKLYASPGRRPVMTVQARKTFADALETPESLVNGAEFIHELLDYTLESVSTRSIYYAVSLYMDWLLGESSTAWTTFAMSVVAYGEKRTRDPLVINEGADRLVFRSLDPAKRDHYINSMRFDGVVLINSIPYDIDSGRSVHALHEGRGIRFGFDSMQYTIARLITYGLGIHTLLNISEIHVKDNFFGMDFETMHSRKPTPWDRVGDTTIITLT